MSRCLLFLGLALQCSAQILYDYLSSDVAANIIRVNQANMDSMIGRMQLQILMAQDLAMLQSFGQQRIASGQASVTYRGSERGSVLAGLDPAGRANAQKVLDAFASALRDKNLDSGNVADCRALGLSMAFYGYRGQDPGPARLAKTRDALREILMRDLAFQGMADYRRQAYCERPAFSAMISAAARNEALRMPPGAERDRLAANAERAGASALRDLSPIAPEGIELTPDGFGDRGERLAKSGGGSTVFRRGASAAAASHDAIWGAGAGARRLERFAGLVRQFGGSENDLADVWATAYAWLLHFRESGRTTSTRAGWTAARDHMRQWAQRQSYWMGAADDVRQRSSDEMALRVAKLIEDREANQRELAQAPPADPVKRMLWLRPVDKTASFAQSADEAIRTLFVAAERPAIERLLRQ